MGKYFKTAEQKRGTKVALRVTTPAVELAGFIALSQPSTKFKPEGEYSARFAMEADTPASKELIALLDDALTRSVELAKETIKSESKSPGDAKSKLSKLKEADPPYTEEFDDSGEPTGRVLFKIKKNATIKTRDGSLISTRPIILDSKKKPVGKSVNIGAGTKAILVFDVMPYYTSAAGAGISLDLQALQIVNLVAYQPGGFNANSYFEDRSEDDGYINDDEDTASDSTVDSSDDSSDF